MRRREKCDLAFDLLLAAQPKKPLLNLPNGFDFRNNASSDSSDIESPIPRKRDCYLFLTPEPEETSGQFFTEILGCKDGNKKTRKKLDQDGKAQEVGQFKKPRPTRRKPVAKKVAAQGKTNVFSVGDSPIHFPGKVSCDWSLLEKVEIPSTTRKNKRLVMKDVNMVEKELFKHRGTENPENKTERKKQRVALSDKNSEVVKLKDKQNAQRFRQKTQTRKNSLQRKGNLAAFGSPVIRDAIFCNANKESYPDNLFSSENEDFGGNGAVDTVNKETIGNLWCNSPCPESATANSQQSSTPVNQFVPAPDQRISFSCRLSSIIAVDDPSKLKIQKAKHIVNSAKRMLTKMTQHAANLTRSPAHNAVDMFVNKRARKVNTFPVDSKPNARRTLMPNDVNSETADNFYVSADSRINQLESFTLDPVNTPGDDGSKLSEGQTGPQHDNVNSLPNEIQNSVLCGGASADLCLNKDIALSGSKDLLDPETATSSAAENENSFKSCVLHLSSSSPDQFSSAKEDMNSSTELLKSPDKVRGNNPARIEKTPNRYSTIGAESSNARPLKKRSSKRKLIDGSASELEHEPKKSALSSAECNAGVLTNNEARSENASPSDSTKLGTSRSSGKKPGPKLTQTCLPFSPKQIPVKPLPEKTACESEDDDDSDTLNCASPDSRTSARFRQAILDMFLTSGSDFSGFSNNELENVQTKPTRTSTPALKSSQQETSPKSQETFSAKEPINRNIAERNLPNVCDEQRTKSMISYFLDLTVTADSSGLTPKKKLRRTHDLEDSNNSLVSQLLCNKVVKVVVERLEESIYRAALLGPLTSEKKVLCLCDQTSPIPFKDVFSDKSLRTAKKIGEGSYGEVFSIDHENGTKIAVKIIPVEGSFDVNGGPQMTFKDVLSEVILSKQLHELSQGKSFQTSNFIHLYRVSCVKGKYPTRLLTQWKNFKMHRGTENDNPSMFENDQLYIIFQFSFGGMDLEIYKLQDEGEAESIFSQVACTLAVAEGSLKFEHRDLHWGNILVAPTNKAEVKYVIADEPVPIKAKGVTVSLIDFTLSRMMADGAIVYHDISKDPSIFQGKGDIQYKVYRDMKKHTKENWEGFYPYTNVLWLEYLVQKLMEKLKLPKNRSKRQLSKWRSELKKYKSAEEFVLKCFLV